MKKYRRSNIFIKTALMTFMAFCAVVFITGQFKQNEQRDKIAALKAEIELRKETVTELQARYDAPFDDEYVMRLATDKLNLRLPEEIIFYNDLNK